MVSSIDFQPYLESICHAYAEWWDLYTLTDIEGKVDRSNQTKQSTPFDFGLLMQSVKKEPDALRQEQTEKLERRPILEGIQKSLAVAKHVLLIGRPGSGKSTALARLLLDEAQQNQRSARVMASQGQQRLEERHSILEEERNLRNQKLTQLRKANAIETGAAIQFQLKQQIQDEESPLKALDAELASIEQALGNVSSTPQNAAQADSQERFRIPVLVELRYYKTSVLELIQAFFRRHNLSLEIHQIEALLSDNHLLLLIDGLNELSSDAARQEIVKLRDYRKVSMVFTTRDLSLGGDFGIEKQWEMLPLTEPQMQEFIRSHLSLEQADDMWRQLQDRTRKFAETPLLLWMLCELFEQVQAVPRNLGEVFRMFTRAYENSSIRKHEVAALKGDIQPLSDRSLWFPALKHLAYTMMQGETPVDFRTVISKEEATRELQALFSREPHPDKSARDCLDDLLKYHLLQNRTTDEIEFHHQLFQEYYAAEWLLQRLPDLSDEQLKYYFLNYLKWTEAIALMLGFLEISENQAKQFVKISLNTDLILGARLAGEVETEFQESTIRLVENLETTNLVKILLLEKTQSSKAVNGLREALNHSESNIRRRAAWALRKMPYDVVASLSKAALEDLNPKVRENATWALGESKVECAIPILNTVLERDSSADVRLRAIYALQAFDENEEAMLGLLNATQDSDHNVKAMAAYALEKLDRQKVIAVLAKALYSENILLKVAAIKMLEKLGTEIVIPYLEQAKLDLNQKIYLEATLSLQSVRIEIASQIQKRIESARVNQDVQRQREIEKCTADLTAIHPIQRGNSIRNLTILLGKDSVPIVIEALDDRDGYVRLSACNVLSSRLIRQFPEEIEAFKKAIPKLINHLNDENELCPHAEAASALGQLGDKRACSSLSKAMSYKDPNTRRNAMEASVKLSCQGIEVELLNLLKDTDSLVQSFAIRALGEIQYKESIPELIGLLENADELVQSSIIEALRLFQGDVAAECLPKLVELTTTNIGEQALYVIESIQSCCRFYNYDIAKSPPPSSINSEKILGNGSPTYNFYNSVGNVANNVHGNQITNQQTDLNEQE